MDQLASCAGVSRRTLFNYVPSKIDAVLGVPGDDPDPALAADFLAGGPTGHLMTDVIDLLRTVFGADELTLSEVARLRQLIRSDARLYTAMHERLVGLVEVFSEVIAEREGAVDPWTALLVTRLTINLIDLALDESLDDGSIDFVEHLGRAYAGVVELLRDAPTTPRT